MGVEMKHKSALILVIVDLDLWSWELLKYFDPALHLCVWMVDSPRSKPGAVLR